MAVSVTHAFVSAIPDGDDDTLVRPSNWNEAHTVTGLGTAAEADTTDFAAAVHTHTASDITDFSTAADARISAAIGITVQAYDADLAAWAGVNPSSYSTTAQIAAAYQPLDADLTAIAALTTTSYGRSLLTMTAAEDVRNSLDTAPYVTTRTALKALDTTKEAVAVLTEAGREGIFVWTSGNFTSLHAADTAEGIYVKATAIASSSGSWVRVYTGPLRATWFGVLADDSTDNAAALTVATAVAGTLNTGVKLSAGVTRVGSAVPLPENVTLEGLGRFVSILKTTSATANILITTGTGVSIRKLGFASSVTRSAGAFVEIAHGLFELSDFYMTGPFIGIYWATAQRSVKVFNGEVIDAVATTGISIDVLSQGVDYSMHDLTLTISSTGARPGAHIRLRQLGDMSMGRIQMYGAVNNMSIEPSTGQGISSLKCENVWFDQASGQGLLVQPTNTGFFKRSSFIGCWFGGNGGSGVNMFPSGASTSIDGIDFNGCEFPSNTTAGFFSGGTAGVISNIDINNCRIPGNGTYGILFDGILGGSIKGCKIGPAGGYGGANGTGVYLAGAATDIRVSGNDMRGNTTAALTNAASGVVYVNDNTPGLVESILTADRNGTDVNTAQAVFGASEDTFTVEGATTYEFEAEYVITRAAGTTSHTTATLFGGTATFTSIDYVAKVSNPTGNVIGAVSEIMATAATATVLTAANTSATENVRVSLRGTMRINAGGTVIPQFQFSAAPGGAPTVKRNSFFRAWPIGNGTVARVGAVA